MCSFCDFVPGGLLRGDVCFYFLDLDLDLDLLWHDTASERVYMYIYVQCAYVCDRNLISFQIKVDSIIIIFSAGRLPIRMQVYISITLFFLFFRFFYLPMTHMIDPLASRMSQRRIYSSNAGSRPIHFYDL